MQRNAPYADTPISISIRANDGMRYRTLFCFECSGAFLERQDKNILRVGTSSMPQEAHMDVDGEIKTQCGKCAQKYAVSLSTDTRYKAGSVPLFQQPQTIYVVGERRKKTRDIYCYECHHAFFGISDRIKLVVDDVIPLSIGTLAPGPIEPRCKFQNCKQYYQMRF